MRTPTAPGASTFADAAGVRAIEAAAMRAWPALEHVEEAGWVLRFAGGYTKRANCATALGPRDAPDAEAGGELVGCGLGVRDGDLAGLFDLAVAPALRGRGHGRRLVDAMLRWAWERGARAAYLQVLATNVAAERLYERAGFREAYRYWFRLPPEP